ncbi:class F sortase [Streptomyces sp. NPDC088725]|uniref:class F sortase n=1 Tax=Streptomyces sp. NPDC088725 TaxID=3365873 RepID=UPI00381DE777
MSDGRTGDGGTRHGGTGHGPTGDGSPRAGAPAAEESDDVTSGPAGTTRDGTRRRTALLVAAAALVVAGGLLLALGLARQQPAPPEAVDKGGPAATVPAKPPSGTPTATPTATPPTASGDSGRAPAALPASEPVEVTIPSLKVSSSLESLGLDGHGAMETPRDPAKAGWYRPGPTPGAEGPSVIAGHVTWNGTPAVFFRLAELDPGDRVEVERRDGRTAVFTVDRVATYAKDAFPSVEVYRNLDHAGLRLITCGGTYSKADHHYADNVVVYASLTSTR